MRLYARTFFLWARDAAAITLLLLFVFGCGLTPKEDLVNHPETGYPVDRSWACSYGPLVLEGVAARSQDDARRRRIEEMWLPFLARHCGMG